MIISINVNPFNPNKSKIDNVSKITNWVKLKIKGYHIKLLDPVPEKPISTNRRINPANRGIKFIRRIDSVPQSTISAIRRIN